MTFNKKDQESSSKLVKETAEKQMRRYSDQMYVWSIKRVFLFLVLIPVIFLACLLIQVASLRELLVFSGVTSAYGSYYLQRYPLFRSKSNVSAATIKADTLHSED